MYDAAPADFNTAVMDFEAAHGKVCLPFRLAIKSEADRWARLVAAAGVSSLL